MGVLNYNGALYLATGIDNSGLKRDASEAERIIEGLGSAAKKVGQMMGVAFTLDTAKDFAVKVIEVRGEFQKLETAFGVLLQSKSKATQLMQEAVSLAATTPFSLQDVASGSKQLLAYGFEAKEITGTLRMLGDVAAGLGLPLERLTYLYGTTLTQGKLMSRDLIQFTTSGIPLLQGLADQFGVTTKEVQALVEEGRVGFPEVQKAFEAMTGAGGKFHGMMEEMSKTVTGRIEKLKDAIEVMFNDIGKSNEGIIYKAIDGASSLVENYAKIGEAISKLVVAYGAYKAILMGIVAFREKKALFDRVVTEQMAVEQRLALSMGKEITESEARQAAQTKLLAVAKGNLATKLKNVAASMAPNLYAAAAVALIAFGKALYDVYTEGTAAEQALKAVNKAMKSAGEDINAEKAKIETLVQVIKNENATRELKEKALKDLHSLYPSLLGDLTEEMIRTGQTTAAIKQYINLRSQQIKLDKLAEQRAKAQDRLDKAEKGDGVSLEKKALIWADEVAGDILWGPINALRQGPKNIGIDKRVAARMEAENEKEKTAAETTLKTIEAEIDKVSSGTSEAVDNTQTKLEQLNKWILSQTYDTVDKVVDKIEEAKKKLAVQRNGAKQGVVNPKDIKATEDQIDDLIKEYQTMTGEKYDKSKEATSAPRRHARDLAKEQKNVAAAMAEIEELTRSARKRIEDADLEMMNEGLEKKLQKIDLDYQRELQEIEEWKKKLEKANEKATGKKDLTKEQQEAYDISRFKANQKAMQARANATNEWKRKEAEAYDEMLQAFGSYKEKEAAIAREYARKIADAEKEGRTNEAERLRREAIQKQASAAESELGKDDTLKTFFKHTEKQTLQAAKKARAEIANTIKYLKTKGEEGTVSAEKAKLLLRMLGDPELVRQTLEGLDADLQKIDDVVEGIQNQKVFDALVANFKKLRKAASGSQEQMAALNGVINGMSNIGSMVTQLGNAMSDCDIKAGKVVSTIGSAITNAASFAAAGASVGGTWGAVAGAVVGAASAIIPAIGKVEEWTEAMEKSYDAQMKWITQARDANLELIKGYGSVAEKVQAATDAINQNAKALELLKQKSDDLHTKESEKGGHSVGYTNKQDVASRIRKMGAFDNYDEWAEANHVDAKTRARWKKYVDRPNVHATQGIPLILEAMQQGYVPLKIKAEFEAQGLDFAKFLADPAGYLINNKEGALNYDQLKWFQDKHPELLAEIDSRQREAIEERMRRLKDESEQIKETLKESLAGVSFDGLLGELESFLKKAGDGSKDLGKTIEGHLRDAIVKGLIDKKTEERIKKAYERIANLMQNREKMSAEEYQKQLQEAKDELTQIYKELAEKKKEAFDKTGLKDYEETKESSMRGALAKASQESIDLLAGVMGAIRVSIEQIIRLMNESRGKGGGVAEYYDSIRQSFAALREIQIAGWKEVTAIKDMVQQIHVTQVTVAQLSQTVADHTASIKETSRRMAESITAINNSGVKIKGGGLGL